MTRKNVEKIMKRSVDTPAVHMGDLVGASISTTVDRSDFEKLITKHGLRGDIALPKLGASNVYRRAVRDAVKSGRRGRRAAGSDAGLAVVLIRETDLVIVHAFVTVDVVEQAKAKGTVKAKGKEFFADHAADLDEVCRVRFSKRQLNLGVSPGGLVTYSVPNHEISRKVRASYQAHAVEYTNNDVRAMFQRAFAGWDGCRVIPHGGLWWIPSTFKAKVAAWGAVVNELGCIPVVLPVYDDAATMDSLRHAAQNSLEGQLADITDGLARFDDPKKNKVGTLEARVADYDALKIKAATYEKILGYKLKQLTKGVQEARKGLLADIAGRKKGWPSQKWLNEDKKNTNKGGK